ncbi:MAG: response regulator [Bdellovibrionaceae bacterium]|nr:response regulator [Pseudobdellovibrionaceae bacterium]
MKILLVEDDRQVGSATKQALTDFGYAVNWVQDGPSAVETVTTEFYDLILLDVGLPKQDGFAVLKNIRAQKNPVPVIFLTARDGVEDKIHGLDLGADDYLVKPFSLEELKARMRVVVRRHHGVKESKLTTSDMSLNLATKEIEREGCQYPLSAKEFSVLHTLMLTPGVIFSKEQLEDSTYGWNEEVASNAIEVIIHGIRKKMGKETILNVRGLGWMVRK